MNPISTDLPKDIPLSAITQMSREDFAALFPGAKAALQGMAQSVAAASSRPACPDCGNWDIDCLCNQEGQAS